LANRNRSPTLSFFRSDHLTQWHCHPGTPGSAHQTGHQLTRPRHPEHVNIRYPGGAGSLFSSACAVNGLLVTASLFADGTS
jgi:hypothetical protein